MNTEGLLCLEWSQLTWDDEELGSAGLSLF